MRAGYRGVLVAASLLVVLNFPAQAQAPSVGLCRAQPCGLVVDWGVGGTTGCQRMGTAAHIRSCAQTGQWVLGGTPDWNDPRYGPASEFPLRVHQHLEKAGYRFTDKLTDVKLAVFLRPEVTNAMCDVVTGTGSTESCRTIGRVRVEFQGDSLSKSPKDFRLTNRCGNGELMTVARFGQYAAEMLDRALSPEQQKSRPSLSCRM